MNENSSRRPAYGQGKRPMIPTPRIFVAAALIPLAACATTSVRTDFAPDVDFDGYQTFALASPDAAAVSGPTGLGNPLMNRRIRNAIAGELRSRGYREVEPEEATFLVAYHAAVEGKLDVQTVNNYYGYGWRGGYVNDTDVRPYDEGTLVVDVVDAGSEELVWRGTVTAEVDTDSSAEKRDERLRDALRKLFDEFPPEASVQDQD